MRNANRIFPAQRSRIKPISILNLRIGGRLYGGFGALVQFGVALVANWRTLATRDPRGIEAFNKNLGKAQRQMADLKNAICRKI